jgi:hypothetical protein
MIFQPMVEVMSYLRANGFKTFIVSAAGRGSCGRGRNRPKASRRSRWWEAEAS